MHLHVAMIITLPPEHNRVQLNNDKCKELRISFTKKSPEFNPILINGEELEIVQSAKLLGVTISHNLSWNNHIFEIVKKAAKRLYFLGQHGGAWRSAKNE